MAAAGEGWAALGRNARAQGSARVATRTVQTPVLTIGFEERGDASGFPVILLHGFPDDVRRAGLERDRRGICRLLWKTWSPTWRFTDATFDRTAVSFDNPDFVDVVIHSYRHRNANAAGEPRYEEVERRLAQRPRIEVPSIVLHGANDGVAGAPPDEPAERAMFSSFKGRRVVRGAGHFLPRERPDVVSSALLELLVATR